MRFINLLPLFAAVLTHSAVAAGTLKAVPVEAGPQVSAYVEVPRNAECHIQVPDEPTAFCSKPGGYLYHLHTFGTMEGWVDPQQVFDNLMQQVTASSNVEILDRYAVPEIVQYRVQRDAPLLYLRGQKVAAFGFDAFDPDKNQRGVSVIVIALIPNNGSPITRIDGFGITVPTKEARALRDWRSELRRFVNSYRYDPQWVQQANAQTVNFEGQLRTRNDAFRTNQQRIHQNNMDALDQSHNAYRERSAASDRMQSGYVDSIHDRQQLIDPNTGTRYEADGYADFNYVNPNDPAINARSNDPLWDPNVNTQQGGDYNRLEKYNPAYR